MPILLSKIGAFNKPENESGTFSLSREHWLSHFGDGDQPPDTYLVGDRVYSAGLYCFFWKGCQKELEELNGVHYIKGKETSATDPRLENTNILVRPEDDGERQYAYHPIEWKFREIEIGNEVYIPLYIGKSSKIYDRIVSHLRWPGLAGSPPLVNEFDLDTALKPNGNTVAQFLQGFEYLLRSFSPENRRIKLTEKVALSICPSGFAQVSDRFYNEDLLIGTFRPPFNVDSER
jgi:hypothetical protein